MSYNVSVIVPVYNVENYLSQCLESILNQTLKNIEIICINDGSKDSSKNILEKYQSQDKRIVILNKSNAGYGAACNYGLMLAKGEYISIVEPDDFIDKRMYQDLYELASAKKADIVKSSYYEYRDYAESEEESINKINWSEQYKMPDETFTIENCPQFLYFHPSIWSCIYKTSFLKKNKIKFVEPKGAGWADNPFQVKTLCLAERIAYTDNAYYYYRLTNPQSSSSVVNINNPFDRSDEIHNFLDSNNINNENMLAHLYKREFGYIDIVLSCITTDLFDYAFTKINKLVKRMNTNIIYNNKFINDYEKNSFKNCLTKEGLTELMKQVKQRNNSLAVKALIE